MARTTRKTSGKRAAAKRAPARKASGKKAAAKKTGSKKTAAKKSGSKTSAARKAPVKKSAAKSAARSRAKTARSASKKTARRREPLAIELLKRDHREVEGYFKKYERLDDEAAKGELATKICLALTVHTQIEEEIFYRDAREEDVEEDLLDEAYVEHASAKDLIAQIRAMNPGDQYFDAKVKVLGEYIDHHVQEEEGEMFPKVRKARLDTVALGEQLAERKAQIMQKKGMA